MARCRPGLSLSAGIVVADVQHPLDLVIARAIEALEETAKKETTHGGYGRDAFAVSWLTGGGHRIAGGHFSDPSGHDLVDDLDQVAADFESRALSRSLASTLQALALEFDDAGPDVVFADLARERMLAAAARAPASTAVLHRWLDTYSPARAAGLVRLARDLATAGPVKQR